MKFKKPRFIRVNSGGNTTLTESFISYLLYVQYMNLLYVSELVSD